MSGLRIAVGIGWSLAFAAVVLAVSCGKKGPPVPPDQPLPPRVEALAADLQDQSVTLRWVQSKESAPVAAYGIYRAATALEGADCTDCPLLFQKQGEVEAPAGQTAFQFSEAVKPGFRYTYKVRPYFEDGAPGPYSHPVAVQVLP